MTGNYKFKLTIEVEDVSGEEPYGNFQDLEIDVKQWLRENYLLVHKIEIEEIKD